MREAMCPPSVTCLACGWVSTAPADCATDGSVAAYQCSRYQCEGRRFRVAQEKDAPILAALYCVEGVDDQP